MNVADSQRVGSSLEHLGYTFTSTIEEADVIVLNTCVVRQSAEDKALGRLSSLKPLKEKNPDLVINLMGCLVGVRGAEKLREKLPMVDVFSPPSDPGPLISHLTQGEIHALETDETTRRFEVMDGDLLLPVHEQGKLVSAHIPVVYGCSHACTFCIIPYKRGIERSRPVGDIVAEVRSLAAQGVREVTLLGQIVDRYGKDIPDGPDLAGLLRIVHEVEGIQRIRFLTSHPNYFSEELMDTVAELPKLMPHIEVPIQAGDDEVLANMKRGYTQQDYRDLVATIRERIPDCSIATDIIVGFPGETEEQFMETYRVLSDLRLDVAHLARYSPRTNTVSKRRMDDDVRKNGNDIPNGPDLAGLLRIVHEVDGIQRIRFLTSHPSYFSEELMDTVAELPKLMPHIEVPIQAGDDEVLANMKRGYTQQDYRDLVATIRERIPDCSIATDIIVGFPGETEEQFMETYRILSDLRLDVAHLARYSPRTNTVSKRRMDDDVSDKEKRRRFHLLEDLQEEIVGEINAKLLGEQVEVLFEEKVKGRWKGRTPTNKLVFVELDDDLRGKIEHVTVTWTGPWSMQASLLRQPVISI